MGGSRGFLPLGGVSFHRCWKTRAGQSFFSLLRSVAWLGSVPLVSQGEGLTGNAGLGPKNHLIANLPQKPANTSENPDVKACICAAS